MTVSRKREDVQARHQEIHRLRRKPRFTLKAIAAEVGLTDHSSVWWHLSGLCRCEGTNEPHTHVWECECGARG